MANRCSYFTFSNFKAFGYNLTLYPARAVYSHLTAPKRPGLNDRKSLPNRAEYSFDKGGFMPNKKDFFDLFIDELRDMYSAENQLVGALPKLAKAANSKELKDAFKSHLKETKHQVERLDEIFQQLMVDPTGVECEGMKGLIKEGSEVLKHFPKASDLRDAALIAAAQRVEHYEIAVYGTLRTYANHLEMSDIADLLQASLDEEGNANKKLTSIAEGSFFTEGINEKAMIKQSSHVAIK